MTLHESYKLILAGYPKYYLSDMTRTGICVYVNYLYDMGVFTEHERFILMLDIRKNKPDGTKLNTWSYWWELSNKGLQQRIKFLQDRTELTRLE